MVNFNINSQSNSLTLDKYPEIHNEHTGAFVGRTIDGDLRFKELPTVKY